MNMESMVDINGGKATWDCVILWEDQVESKQKLTHGWPQWIGRHDCNQQVVITISAKWGKQVAKSH